jgi:hypothetical protein
MLNYKKIKNKLLVYETNQLDLHLQINHNQYVRLLKHLKPFNAVNSFDSQLIDVIQNNTYGFIVDIVIHGNQSQIQGYQINIDLDIYIIVLTPELLTIQIQFDTLNQQNIDNLLTNLLRIMNGTFINYAQATKNLLMNDINVALSENKLLSLANFNQIFNTVVSIKPHGKRAMLIIHSTGLWFVHNDEYNLLIEPNEKINNLLNAFNTTIFDGYLVKPLNTRLFDFNYMYWYLCTDCLVFSKTNVTNADYVDRIDYAKVLSSLMSTYIDDTFLKVSLQTTRYTNNINTFYENTYYMLKLTEGLNYNTVGLTFKSINHYQSSIDWIDPTQLTVNLKVDNNHLFTSDNQLFTKIEYEGQNQTSSFRWNVVTKQLDQIKSVKKTDDLTTALDKWHFMQNPIIYDDVIGNSMTYLKYNMSQFITNLLSVHIKPSDKVLTLSKNNLFYDVTLPSTDPKNILTLKSVKNPVDVIVLTSLSKYWEYEDKLNGLVKTCNLHLKPNGKILFFTLSGDHLDYLMKESKEVTLSPVTLINNDNIITINYENKSIIENKAYLQDLTTKLIKQNIHLTQFNRFESDNLSHPMQILSSLFCYGYYTK